MAFKRRGNFQYLIKPFSENADQQVVVNYLKARYPGVKFTTGLLGIHLPAWAQWLLMALGYSMGTPDIMIFKPVTPTGPVAWYYGLFIELKRKSFELIEDGERKKYPAGKPSTEQIEWCEYLNANGYQAKVCTGSQEAIDTIDQYFKGSVK
jgi:hypothetical protein